MQVTFGLRRSQPDQHALQAAPCHHATPAIGPLSTCPVSGQALTVAQRHGWTDPLGGTTGAGSHTGRRVRCGRRWCDHRGRGRNLIRSAAQRGGGLSLNSVFNRFVKSLADFLAEYQFERNRRVFRRFSPEGDAVVLDLQTSTHSDRSSRIFYVNVAFSLAPDWAWTKQLRGRSDDALPQVVDGVLWRRIYLPGDPLHRWEIRDEATAALTLERLKGRLREEMPNLVRLLDRVQLRALAERKELTGEGAWSILAWLLAEEGRTDEVRRIVFDERPKSTHTSDLARGIWQLATSRKAQAQRGG